MQLHSTTSFGSSSIASCAVAAFLLLGAAGAVSAQEPQCQFGFRFTAAAQVTVDAAGDNRNRACDNWKVTYQNTGFSALSLVFESAPLSGSGPGAYVTFAGTVLSGVNPNTATTQASSTFSGYFPFNRMRLASVTGSGTITGIVQGWKVEPAGGAAAGATQVEGRAASGAAPVGNPVFIGGQDGGPLVRPLRTDTSGRLEPSGASTALGDGVSNTVNLPVPGGAAGGERTFPFLFNGSTWDRDFSCTQQAAFDLTASGNTQIIAASGSTVVRICHISLVPASAVDIRITQGTGADCATGTANVSGLYRQVTSLALDPGASKGHIRGNASQAICINQGAAVNTGGIVTFAQF